MWRKCHVVKFDKLPYYHSSFHGQEPIYLHRWMQEDKHCIPWNLHHMLNNNTNHQQTVDCKCSINKQVQHKFLFSWHFKSEFFWGWQIFAVFQPKNMILTHTNEFCGKKIPDFYNTFQQVTKIFLKFLNWLLYFHI